MHVSKSERIVSDVYSQDDLHGYDGIVATGLVQKDLYYDTIRLWLFVGQSKHALNASRSVIHAIATRYLVNVSEVDKIARMRPNELTARVLENYRNALSEALRDNHLDLRRVSDEYFSNPFVKTTKYSEAWDSLKEHVNRILVNQELNRQWVDWLMHHFSHRRM
jgi:hypothetical protein